jgi:hypothetical protein
VALEAVALSAEVRQEAGAQSVEVEPSRRRVAHVVERVDEIGRYEHEGARRCAHRLDIRTHSELKLALDDVERVDVAVVDVRLRPALSGLVTRPGDVDQGVLVERAHRPLGEVRHRIAVVDGQEGCPGHVRLHVIQPIHSAAGSPRARCQVP